MNSRRILIKQTIALFTEYKLSYQNLFKIYRERAVLQHWKNIKAEDLLQSAQLMKEIFFEFSNKRESLTREKAIRMKFNMDNMIKTLDYAMEHTTQKKITIDELSQRETYDKDPNLQLKEILLKVSQYLSTNNEDDKTCTDEKIEPKEDDRLFPHPYEEQFLSASFKDLLSLIKDFPLKEFKVFSQINENKNTLTFNKNGELIVSEQGFFSKIFNLSNPPPLRLMKNILSKAFITASFIERIFQQEILIHALPESAKIELKAHIENIASIIQNSYIGITLLLKKQDTNTFIAKRLERMKAELLIMVNIFEKCRVAIPIHQPVKEILGIVGDVDEAILGGDPFDLAHAFNQTIALYNTLKIARNESIAIQDISKNLRNATLAKLREYLEYAESILDIETTEDYLFALEICRDVSKATEILCDEGAGILEKAKKLELHILGKLDYIKDQEDSFVCHASML